MVKTRLKEAQKNRINHFVRIPGLSIIFFSLFLLFHTGTIWAKVSASTGRTVLSIDETLVLKIKSENTTGDPDLTELEKDFQIMGRSQSQNYSLINGQASQTHTWNITLLPKRTGELIIPAIKVGNEMTHAIQLVIQKQSNTPAIDGKEVFLKIDIASDKNLGNSLAEDDPAERQNNYYVQQQIIVVVKLFHRIRFSNATLSDLELTNTVIEKLGNDANYSKTIAKNRYNIIERRYALYPQQSGKLIIPVITFTGNAEVSQNYSLFSRPGRQIISRTKAITLNISPIPDSYSGKNWLPAESLEIESRIVEDTHSIIAGEAITRHIIVRARGLLGSQLPITSVASSNTIKTYPDKEKLSNQLINGEVFGVRHDTVAIIPLKPGSFTLPEIKIDWWNTKTNQQETTRIAAQELIALDNNESANEIQDKLSETADKTDSAKNNMTEKQKIPAKSEQKAVNTIEKIIYKKTSLSKNIWFWISLTLLVLWLVTLALFIVASSKNKKTVNKAISTDTNNAQNVKQLQAVYDACRDDNPGQASRALILWARDYFKQPMLPGLSAIIQLIDDEALGQAINDLESSQYSQDKDDWYGKTLSSALSDFIKQNKIQEQSKTTKPQAFASLNPNTN